MRGLTVFVVRKDRLRAFTSDKPEGSGWGDRVRLVAWAVAALAVGMCGAWAYSGSGANRADVVRDLAVGWAFAGSGLIAWWRRPTNRTGQLMLAEGLTWFIGNLQGTSIPLLFAFGAWWEALNLAVMAHLVLAYPEGRLGTRLNRWVAGAAYGTVAGGGLLRAAFFDPAVSSASSYLSCHGCGPNALLIHSDPALFDLIDLVYRWLGALLTIACVVALVRRWRASGPARRRVLLPAWVSVTCSVAFVGWELVYVVAPDFPASGQTLLVFLSDASQTAVPVVFLVGLLRMWLRRAAVGNLILEVGTDPTPGLLQEVLARVVGDPSLRLGLRERGSDGYTGPDGCPLELPQPSSGRTVTELTAGGGDVSAVLVHDAALDDDQALLSAVTASVRLCLENTWLRSEVATRAEEVTAVGSRVVEAVDRERQRLERDLHDGAQTRLIYALMALQRLDAELARGTDERETVRQAVAEADRTLRAALDDLRGIARGIHPAVLTREGLGPAVTALAEGAEIPVVIAMEPGRHAPLVESTAYFTISEALSNTAKHAQARAAHVRAQRSDGKLVIEVIDDGVGGADPLLGSGLRGLADRLAVLGGLLRVHSPAGGGTRVRAELPCE